MEQRTDLQVDALRELARQRNWEVVGEFFDVGWSGARASRPQLDAAMKLVSRGRVDVVCVWKLDRLGRSTKDLLNLLDELRVRNVQLVSAQESIDTNTSMGRAFFTLIGLLGEVEREWLRERTRAGLDAARRRGARIGRPRTYVPVVRARQLMARGMSLRATARKLDLDPSVLLRALRGEGVAEPCARGRT
jgi:DNA invertase Pin-like site-specific DNA recombinase